MMANFKVVFPLNAKMLLFSVIHSFSLLSFCKDVPKDNMEQALQNLYFSRMAIVPMNGQMVYSTHTEQIVKYCPFNFNVNLKRRCLRALNE
jgi:hypothetical protein